MAKEEMKEVAAAFAPPEKKEEGAGDASKKTSDISHLIRRKVGISCLIRHPTSVI